MADSIPDLNLNDTWQNAYALTGIAVGTKLIIQNKSTSACLVFLSASAPPAGSRDGWSIPQRAAADVDAGESGCWLRGSGPVCVQVG